MTKRKRSLRGDTKKEDKQTVIKGRQRTKDERTYGGPEQCEDNDLRRPSLCGEDIACQRQIK